VKHRL